MKVYLDNCALNRPFDDQRQPRIRMETEAVELILAKVEEGAWAWYSSQVVRLENAQTPDEERREKIDGILSIATETVAITASIEERAVLMEAMGFTSLDALHLASAEAANVDAFVTCDDKLYKRAKRLSARLNVRVVNPTDWIKEVTP